MQAVQPHGPLLMVLAFALLAWLFPRVRVLRRLADPAGQLWFLGIGLGAAMATGAIRWADLAEGAGRAGALAELAILGVGLLGWGLAWGDVRQRRGRAARLAPALLCLVACAQLGTRLGPAAGVFMAALLVLLGTAGLRAWVREVPTRAAPRAPTLMGVGAALALLALCLQGLLAP